MTYHNRHRAVFLDRDGVINKAIIENGTPVSPHSMDMVSIPEDVPAALKHLKKAGFILIVITNQPDVARGKVTKDTVEKINALLRSQLSLDDVIVCYHDDQDHCECRKPKPGMIYQAAQKFSIDLTSSFVVGDRWKDIEAGKSAGCKTIFIDLGYVEEKPSPPADLTVSSLQQAIPWILAS